MEPDDRLIAATLRRCKGRPATPSGVSTSDVATAMERGLIQFREWPSGHFALTDAGRNFLSALTE